MVNTCLSFCIAGLCKWKSWYRCETY